MRDRAMKKATRRQDVRSAVIRKVAKHPATLACLGAGLAVALAGLFMGGIAAIAAGVVICLGAVIVHYRLRFAQFSAELMREAGEGIERQRQKRLGEVRADLYDLARSIHSKDKAGDLAAQALEQFGAVHEKVNLFTEILNRKLSPGELAHARYLAAANDFLIAIIDRLAQTRETLQIVSAQNAPELREEQLQKVRNLLSDNRGAMEAFDRTTAELSSMRTLGTRSADIDEITRELDRLASQAKRLGQL